MSAIGPKRTSLIALHMSAFGGKADMTFCGANIRFWHKADIYDTIPDLLLMRVRSWTSVQLDLAA
jgi:hypothetical protein